jgi:hypothetical protein
LFRRGPHPSIPEFAGEQLPELGDTASVSLTGPSNVYQACFVCFKTGNTYSKIGTLLTRVPSQQTLASSENCFSTLALALLMSRASPSGSLLFTTQRSIVYEFPF